jgi:hypothetical protein
MFRFTIRGVLLLTVIVGISVGWWADRRRLESRLAEASVWRTCAGGLEEVLRQTGQTVEWNWERSQVCVTQPSGVTYGACLKSYLPDTGIKQDLTCLR